MRIEAGALCPPNSLADLLWRYGRAIEFDFERTERVRDRVRECSRRPDRAAFADSLDAERIERRWRMLVNQLQRRTITGGRQQVIHQ
jgi:hypothetical protein